MATGPSTVGEKAQIAGADKETASKISDMGKSVVGSNKLLEQVASTAESDLQQSAENHETSQTEKLVKEKKNTVWIAGLDDKASKQFGGMFGGLKKMFGKTTPAKAGPPSPEDDGMGFWGWLGVILLGFSGMILPLITGAITGLFAIVGGLFTLPLTAFAWAGGLLIDIVTAPLKLVFKGIKGLFSIGQWFGGLVGKGATYLAGKVGGWWKSIKGGFSSLFGGKAAGVASKAGAKGATKVLASSATAAADDVAKGAAKGMEAGAKAGKKTAMKTAAKGILKGAARLAGPVAALGFMAFDGISAGMEEYKKSGSLLAAAKEGTAGALSGLTFGLVSQETISGAMSAIGDGIGSVVNGTAKLLTDPIGAIGDAGSAISRHASSLLDSATGWLFGSPHATHYINKSGDDIHDSSSSLADSASSMVGAGKVMAKQAVSAGSSLVSSAADMVGSSDAWQKGTELASKGLSKAGDTVQTQWAKAGDALLSASPPLRGVKYLWDTVSGWFSDSEDEVKKATSGSIDGTGAIKAAGDGVTSQAEYILKLVGQIFKDVIVPLETSVGSLTGGEMSPEDREAAARRKKYEGKGFSSLASENKYRGEDGVVRNNNGTEVRMDRDDLNKYAPKKTLTKPAPEPKEEKGWWDKLVSWNSDRMKQEGTIMESQARAMGYLQEDPKLKKPINMLNETDQFNGQKDMIDQNRQMIAKLDKICEYQQQQLDLVDAGNKDRRTQTDSVTEAAGSGGDTTVVNNTNQAAIIPTTEGSNDLTRFRSRITNFA